MYTVSNKTKFVAGFAFALWSLAFTAGPTFIGQLGNEALSQTTSIAVFVDKLKVPDGDVTKYPASRNVYISLKSDDYIIQNSYSDLVLTMRVESPTGRERFNGRQVATVRESQYIAAQPRRSCSDIPDPQADCVLNDDNEREVSFQWRLEAQEPSQTALTVQLPDEALRLFLEPELNPVHLNPVDPLNTEDSGETKSPRNNITFANENDWSSLEMVDDDILRLSGGYLLDTSQGLVDIPIQVRTPLHLTLLQDYLFKLFGTFLLGILSFSLLPDIVQTVGKARKRGSSRGETENQNSEDTNDGR